MAFARNAVQPYDHSVATAQPFAPRYRVAYPSSEDPFTIVTLTVDFNNLHADSPLRSIVTDGDLESGDEIKRDTTADSGEYTRCDTDGRMGIENNVPGTFDIYIRDKSNGYNEVGPISVTFT